MNKKEKYYYAKTETEEPHVETKKIINLLSHKGTAVDLGCGSGRDTIALLKSRLESNSD